MYVSKVGQMVGDDWEYDLHFWFNCEPCGGLGHSEIVGLMESIKDDAFFFGCLSSIEC